MYNLRPDLIAGIQEARDAAGLSEATLVALSVIGTDLDRLWAAVNQLKARDHDQERSFSALAAEIQQLGVRLNALEGRT